MATGTLLFSHIIPPILGFFGILLLITGIMDDEQQTAIIGVILFLIAAISPFLILSAIL